MAFIPVPDTAQFNFRGVVNGELVENTLYFKDATAITAVDLANTADSLAAGWSTDICAVLGTQYVFTSCFARDLTVDAGFEHESFVGTGTSGGVAGAALPNNVSWVVKFLTGLAGRSFRGRNYVAGLNAGMVSDQDILGGRADDIVTQYTLFLTSNKPAGWDWVIASRFHLNAPRVTGITTPVTNVGFTDLVIDSQRRRLPGRGT